jgi:hypothetical protein
MASLFSRRFVAYGECSIPGQLLGLDFVFLSNYVSLSMIGNKFATPFVGKVRPMSAVSSANLGSADNLFEESRIKKQPGEENNRAFTYFMLGNTRFIYASASRLTLMKVTTCCYFDVTFLFDSIILISLFLFA